MKRRTRSLLLAWAAAIALAVGVAWSTRPDVPASTTGRAEPAPAAALEADRPLAPSGDARPVSGAVPEQTRADAGDGVAACRLAITLMRCQIAARKGFDEPDCASLPPGLADRAQHYLRAAAVAGEPNARYLYASGAGFEAMNDFGYLRTPAFDQWRREAGPLMQRAFDDGDPRAALMLSFAYGHDLGPFAGLVEDDDLRVAAHGRLSERLFGASLASFPIPLPTPRSPLSQEASAQAEAMASQWHRENFTGRDVDLVALMAASEPPPWSRKASPEAMQRACTPPEEAAQ